MWASRPLYLSCAAAAGGFVACNLVAGFPDFEIVDDPTTAAGGAGAHAGSGGAAGGSEKCTTPEQCSGEDTTCATRTCDNGTCGFDYALSGTACTDNQGAQCDGQGQCVECVSADQCSSPKTCISGWCTIHAQWAEVYDGSSNDEVTDGVVDSLGNTYLTGQFQGELDFGGTTSKLSANGSDKDIFVAKIDSSGVAVWSKSISGTAGSTRSAHGIAVDSQGEVFVIGAFKDTLDLTTKQIVTAGDQNDFVARLSGTDGACNWVDSFGDDSKQSGRAIVVNSDDKIIVAGRFDGVILFPGSGLPKLMNSNGDDIFVAQMSVVGNQATTDWYHSFGDGNIQDVDALAIDDSNNVLLVGGFQGTVNFGSVGSDALTTPNTCESTTACNGYIAKFNASGEHQWSKRFGDSYASPRRVLADGDDNVILAGYFEGPIEFGGDLLYATDSSDAGDIFLAKLSSSGTHVWSNSFGDDNLMQEANGLVADTDGNLFMSGQFKGSVNFGNGSLSAAPGSVNWDLYLAKFAADGTSVYSQRFGDVNDDRTAALGVAANGNIYVSGTFSGNLDFGTGVLQAPASDDAVFVVQFEP